MPIILSKAVGISLGTTNSAVGLMNPADSDVILYRDEASRDTTPSCVWQEPHTGEIVVGHQAYCRRGTAPLPLRSFKRLMGQSVKLNLGRRQMSPEELSAEVLKEMKRQIEQETRKLSQPGAVWTVNRAIVTVPAYFDEPQVSATRTAAKLAGLELLELLHEPTAAAIFHCWRTKSRDGVFIIYDLGGGTFDVTILKIVAGAPTVLGLSGNTQLGGDDIDTAIAEGMLEQLKKEGYALDLDMNDPEDVLRYELLKFRAEGIKKSLSDAPEFLLRDTSTLRDKTGRQVIFDNVYKRSQIVAWMRPVINRTIPCCHAALELAEQKAGVKLSDIDHFILAGGSTHIPAVRERVRKEFCSNVTPAEFAELVEQRRVDEDRTLIAPLNARSKCERPVYEKVDTIVALGAAIRAGAYGGLHLTDPEAKMRVELCDLGVPEKTAMPVTGHVKSLSNQSLAGCKISLYIPEAGYDQKTDLGENGHFQFEEVPFRPVDESAFNFEIFDASHNSLAIVARKMRGDRKGAGAGGESFAILPKAISMDVAGESGKERVELIPALQSLPATATFVLHRLGQADKVRFTLNQGHRLIKEVEVPLSSSPPEGTPIELTINVDKFSFITIQGKVGELTFDAAIETPPPRDLPTPSDLAALETSFREGLAYLDAGPRMAKEAIFKQAMKAYQSALDRHEKEHALHEFEEMEEIVSAVARPNVVLQQLKSVFDNRVKELVELINWGRMEFKKNDKDAAQTDDWRAKADDYRQAGEQAYREGVQRKLGDAIQQLTNLKNHVISLLRGQLAVPSPPSPAQQAAFLLGHMDENLANLKIEAETVMDKEAQRNIEKLLHDLQGTSELAERDPNAALSLLMEINAKIKTLKQQFEIPVSPETKSRPTRLPGDHSSLRAVSSKVREDQIPKILPSELGAEQESNPDSLDKPRLPAQRVVASIPQTSADEETGSPYVPGGSIDSVHFSVTSPPALSLGLSHMVDVWAHLATQHQQVVAMAREEAGGAKIQIRSEGPFEITRGNVVKVRLKIQDLMVKPYQKTILWKGEIGKAGFIVEVPKTAGLGTKQGTATILLAGVPLVRLFFIVQVGKATAPIESLATEVRRYRSAFISYADDDRNAVLARIQGLKKGNRNLDVFWPPADMEPGTKWQETLKHEILARDVMYLFWSEAASRSKWVDWEWRFGYENRGIDFIDPCPLAPPKKVPPPKELADQLHFDDWVLAYMSGCEDEARQ